MIATAYLQLQYRIFDPVDALASTMVRGTLTGTRKNFSSNMPLGRAIKIGGRQNDFSSVRSCSIVWLTTAKKMMSYST